MILQAIVLTHEAFNLSSMALEAFIFLHIVGQKREFTWVIQHINKRLTAPLCKDIVSNREDSDIGR